MFDLVYSSEESFLVTLPIVSYSERKINNSNPEKALSKLHKIFFTCKIACISFNEDYAINKKYILLKDKNPHVSIVELSYIKQQ